ncbi:E3 ubiquitin-protein ligase BRE1A-like, partial [Haemorhous mexicanus]|uniref:E3 ubiquitin-protein ligase BRE1A-like n=1 Tax=Haemorhous mexicanus TaxID=30427 RepID=UPI0028BD93A0
LQFSKLQERVETAESRVSVLETMTDDLQWDIDKIRKREQRLSRHLADVLERVNSKGYKVYGAGSILCVGTITISACKVQLSESVAPLAAQCVGPINREMSHLISSLQNHKHQLKGEMLRYKRKLREAQSDLSKIRSRSGSALLQSQSSTEDTKEEPAEIKQEPADPSAHGTVPKAASEDVNEMKARKAQESQKEMKLLLDTYHSAPKVQRHKVQLMAAEKKAKAELEELRQRVKGLEDKEKKESKKMADEDALCKVQAVEEQIEYLQKKLAMAKQEEEALLLEMDVTGQAFEDMQEQNICLMRQPQKDDANVKLMSERIKSNQIHKLLKEEKEELADQVLTLKTQLIGKKERGQESWWGHGGVFCLF